jgi:hypothetical protein
MCPDMGNLALPTDKHKRPGVRNTPSRAWCHICRVNFTLADPPEARDPRRIMPLNNCPQRCNDHGACLVLAQNPLEKPFCLCHYGYVGDACQDRKPQACPNACQVDTVAVVVARGTEYSRPPHISSLHDPRATFMRLITRGVLQSCFSILEERQKCSAVPMFAPAFDLACRSLVHALHLYVDVTSNSRVW